jgi:hypothetical protein
MKKTLSDVILSAAKNLGNHHCAKVATEILSAAKNDMSRPIFHSNLHPFARANRRIVYSRADHCGRPVGRGWSGEFLRQVGEQRGVHWLAQGAQGLDLDLPHALPRQLEAFAQLFQRVAGAILQAVAKLDHQPLTGG